MKFSAPHAVAFGKRGMFSDQGQAVVASWSAAPTDAMVYRTRWRHADGSRLSDRTSRRLVYIDGLGERTDVDRPARR